MIKKKANCFGNLLNAFIVYLWSDKQPITENKTHRTTRATSFYFINIFDLEISQKTTSNFFFKKKEQKKAKKFEKE